jgi:hypothetical protein
MPYLCPTRVLLHASVLGSHKRMRQSKLQETNVSSFNKSKSSTISSCFSNVAMRWTAVFSSGIAFVVAGEMPDGHDHTYIRWSVEALKRRAACDDHSRTRCGFAVSSTWTGSGVSDMSNGAQFQNESVRSPAAIANMSRVLKYLITYIRYFTYDRTR